MCEMIWDFTCQLKSKNKCKKNLWVQRKEKRTFKQTSLFPTFKYVKVLFEASNRDRLPCETDSLWQSVQILTCESWVKKNEQKSSPQIIYCCYKPKHSNETFENSHFQRHFSPSQKRRKKSALKNENCHLWKIRKFWFCLIWVTIGDFCFLCQFTAQKKLTVLNCFILFSKNNEKSFQSKKSDTIYKSPQLIVLRFLRCEILGNLFNLLFWIWKVTFESVQKNSQRNAHKLRKHAIENWVKVWNPWVKILSFFSLKIHVESLKQREFFLMYKYWIEIGKIWGAKSVNWLSLRVKAINDFKCEMSGKIPQSELSDNWTLAFFFTFLKLLKFSEFKKIVSEKKTVSQNVWKNRFLKKKTVSQTFEKIHLKKNRFWEKNCESKCLKKNSSKFEKWKKNLNCKN